MVSAIFFWREIDKSCWTVTAGQDGFSYFPLERNCQKLLDSHSRSRWFQLFSFGEKLSKVAGQSQQVKMVSAIFFWREIVKSCWTVTAGQDGFSYFLLERNCQKLLDSHSRSRWFQLFSSGEKLTKVAGQSQQVKMVSAIFLWREIDKSCWTVTAGQDGFSYFPLERNCQKLLDSHSRSRWFQLFSSGEKLSKVAGQSRQVKMVSAIFFWREIVKSCWTVTAGQDGFSYFPLERN